jgi:hypothetical protein
MGRFSRKRGHFGILVCRSIKDKALMLRRLQGVVNNTDGLIMVLDDDDIKALLTLKVAGQDREISDYLEDKVKPILM